MPNVLAQPRFWRKKAVLLTDEATYGDGTAPTGAVNWMEARNVQLNSFDAETVDRNIEMPYYGNGGKIISSIWSTLSFDVALAPFGVAGTAPKWGPIMLGGGFSETVVAATSVAYNLVTDDIGSLCAYLNIDGTLYKFVGSRAELKGKLTAKGIPLLSVEMTSLYTSPVAGAMPIIDRSGWAIEEAVNAANTGKLTLNGVDLAFSELNWACGNQLSRISLPGPQLEVAIGDRQPTAACTVLAPALGVFNPYVLAESSQVVDLTNTHGTAAGKKVKTDMKVKVLKVGETSVDGMLAYNLTLEPSPVAGNDEIALTCL